MLKGVLTHVVQGVAVGQLGLPQGLELLSIRRQFELGGKYGLHERNIARFHQLVKRIDLLKNFLCLRPARLSSLRLKPGASRRDLVKVDNCKLSSSCHTSFVCLPAFLGESY